MLDEDAQALREIEQMASAWFNVITTRSPQKALTTLHSDASVAVLLTEQTLGKTSGLTVLRAAQTLRPAVRRVLMATAGQLALIIEGLHCGAVERVVYKPVRSHDLAAALSLPEKPPARATA